MKQLIVSSAPHIHSPSSARRIMLDVIIALLPSAVMAAVNFGGKAVALMAACVISAVLSEFLFNLIARREQSVSDLSAVVTGLLLALNLSTNVPIWEGVVGSAFAIIIVKCLFGGLGHNFANPAITARVFMLLAFSEVAGGAFPAGAELVSSATPLELIPNGLDGLPGVWEMLIGRRGGAIGEGCILALLAGYAYLVARKVIKWYVPAIFVGTVFVCSLAASGSFMTALYEILAGGLVLGAVFMATDYVTTPINARGRAVFALGCGLITFIIRQFLSYPEGVSISILTMNILSPYIEKWTADKPLGGS